ncbi:MAG: WXG100 family type VII secretion target [[Mycobacterium] stephanolepidis]
MGKHSAQPEDWYSRNHQNIYDIAQGFQSGKVGSLAQNVSGTADKLHEIMNALGGNVQKILGNDWRGLAAQTGQEKCTEFFQKTDQGVIDKVRDIGRALPPVGSAMDAAKSSIQPPMSTETYRMGKTMGLSDSDMQKKAAEDQEHARYQMTSAFSQPAVDASGHVEDVTDPTQGTAGPAPVSASNAGGGSSGNGASKTLGQVDDQLKNLDGVGKTNPAFDRGMGDGQSAGQGQGAGASGGGSGGGSGSGGSGSGSGAGGLGSGLGGRSTPTLNDGYLTRPSSWMQDPLGRGGGSSGPGSATGGSLRDGLPPGANPGAGQGNSGGVNPSGVSSSGVRGTGPMGMMGAGGAGHGKSGKDDEGEHKIPKFLVNMENTERLVGPIKPASPAVIGDWDAHEREDPDFRQ